MILRFGLGTWTLVLIIVWELKKILLGRIVCRRLNLALTIWLCIILRRIKLIKVSGTLLGFKEVLTAAILLALIGGAA